MGFVSDLQDEGGFGGFGRFVVVIIKACEFMSHLKKHFVHIGADLRE